MTRFTVHHSARHRRAGRPVSSRGKIGIPDRRGSLLVELAMAVILLTVAMTLTVRVLGWVAHDRRASEQRERAIAEVGNLMERITAHTFDEVTPVLVGDLKLSDGARQSLPDSELAIDLKEGDGPAARRLSAKRIAIRLRWRGRDGQWQAPVRLTAWIERRGGGS